MLQDIGEDSALGFQLVREVFLTLDQFANAEITKLNQEVEFLLAQKLSFFEKEASSASVSKDGKAALEVYLTMQKQIGPFQAQNRSPTRAEQT